MAPGLGWLALFLVVPCALILVLSFFERGAYGGIDHTFTLENFTRAADPLYLTIFLRSARIAAMATLIAILIGYPAAAAIAAAPKERQTALLILIMLPFWTNYLIRTYAWMVLLNRSGLINSGLIGAGIITEPVSLLYTEGAIVTGLVYSYLPFMVLSIYSAHSRISPELHEASEDLGATNFMTFLRVTLPLTLSGVGAGAVFVFVLSIGNFITPDLLGGGRVMMIGNAISGQFLVARDWPFGSALSLGLIGIMLLLLFAQALLVSRGSQARSVAHG